MGGSKPPLQINLKSLTADAHSLSWALTFSA